MEPVLDADDMKALTDLSVRLLDIKKRKDEAEKDYQTVRKTVFAIADRLGGKESKLAVEVYTTGRRIGRTMVYGSPSVDLDRLLELVGPTVFDKVTTTTVTRSIDFEALAQALKDELITESTIKKAMIAGKVTERILHSKVGSAEDKREQEGVVPKSPLEGLVEF